MCKLVDDSLYNYDAHRYQGYLLASGGVKSIDWVMGNTSIIHFCGKTKPWHKTNRSRFGILYEHYASMTEKTTLSKGYKQS